MCLKISFMKNQTLVHDDEGSGDMGGTYVEGMQKGTYELSYQRLAVKNQIEVFMDALIENADAVSHRDWE